MASPDRQAPHIPCRITIPGLIVEQYTHVISPSPPGDYSHMCYNKSLMKRVAALPTLLSRIYPIDIPSFLGEYLSEGYQEGIQLLAVVLGTHRKKKKLYAHATP